MPVLSDLILERGWGSDQEVGGDTGSERRYRRRKEENKIAMWVSEKFIRNHY